MLSAINPKLKPAIDTICEQIASLNPIHGKRLKKNLPSFDERYHRLAEAFFERYAAILHREKKSLEYAIGCYLQMVADVNIETVEFQHTGKYSSSSFEEVNRRVYARPETMEYYMHGLILSQFLWKHHYLMFDYFITNLPRYAGAVKNYLEVGVGHGFYLSRALEVLAPGTRLTAVDISKTSLAMAKAFVGDSPIDFRLQDIFTFGEGEGEGEGYDFITLGEVLEHVEDPLNLLSKLRQLLSDNGVLFFTTPANAPAIDHIYLFHNVEEIRELARSAGFRIESELALLSEDISWERAEKLRIAVLYGAFLRKNVQHG
jgi:2-polyprenyl-3-methyl-5-hydroxy-6-metoxy-1,4-benzoquinol methylase